MFVLQRNATCFGINLILYNHIFGVQCELVTTKFVLYFLLENTFLRNNDIKDFEM